MINYASQTLVLYTTYDLIYFIDYVPGDKPLEGLIGSMEKDTPRLRELMVHYTDLIAHDNKSELSMAPSKAILHFEQMLSMLRKEHNRHLGFTYTDDWELDSINAEQFYMHHSIFHESLRQLVLMALLDSQEIHTL